MAKKYETDKSGSDLDVLPREALAPPVWTTELITPEMAAEYLRANIINRPMNAYDVDKYRRDMENGDWLFTGDPIRFNTEGKLFDGQHRLKACTLANRPFKAIVGRNLPVETVNVVDTGRPRRASDILTMREVPYATIVGGAAKWLLLLRGLQGMDKPAGKTPSFRIFKTSNQEVLKVVDKHPLLLESCRFPKRPVGMRPTLLAAIHYAGKHLVGQAELADAFHRVFVDGIPYYEENDPALKLREISLRQSEKQLYALPVRALMSSIYAWNHFVAGRPIQAFKPPAFVKMTGLKPEMI